MFLGPSERTEMGGHDGYPPCAAQLGLAASGLARAAAVTSIPRPN